MVVPSGIDAGSPSSRDEWPQGVLDGVAPFTCGDVVAGPPFFYFADPARPVWAATKAYTEDSSGPEIIDAYAYAAPYAVITSQTCDVGEVDFDPPAKPWIMLAPVYDLTNLKADLRALLRQGKGPLHWLHLPQLATVATGFWIADFRIEMPVEKGWLANQQILNGFNSALDKLKVAQRISLIRSRPAWSDLVVEHVQRRLHTVLKDLRDSDRAMFDLVQSTLEEIGCRTDDMLNPTALSLAAFYRGDIDDRVRDWWTNQVDSIRAGLAGLDVTVFPTQLKDLGTVPILEYREYQPMPIQRFSPFDLQ